MICAVPSCKKEYQANGGLVVLLPPPISVVGAISEVDGVTKVHICQECWPTIKDRVIEEIAW